MRSYRAWAAEAARTVNSGHYVTPGLRKLMTADFALTMKHVIGTYYPGPNPVHAGSDHGAQLDIPRK